MHGDRLLPGPRKYQATLICRSEASWRPVPSSGLSVETRARLTPESGRRTELFRNYLSELMNGSLDEGSYSHALLQAILELGAGIGIAGGRKGRSSEAPKDLIEICRGSDLGSLYQQSLQ